MTKRLPRCVANARSLKSLLVVYCVWSMYAAAKKEEVDSEEEDERGVEGLRKEKDDRQKMRRAV